MLFKISDRFDLFDDIESVVDIHQQMGVQVQKPLLALLGQPSVGFTHW